MDKGNIAYEHTMKFRALVLDLLVQILIKIHTGARWGEDENRVLALTREASDFSFQCSQIPGSQESEK